MLFELLLGLALGLLTFGAAGAAAHFIEPGADAALNLLEPVAEADGERAPEAAVAESAAWKPALRYQLEARLDVTTHRVFGKGVITWQNTSSKPQRELYLHLYLNAFKSRKTRFMRNGRAAGFRGETVLATAGYIKLERLHAREFDVDLLQHAAAHSPGDGADETDIRVALPRAVAPGERLTLEVAWTSQLPSILLRTGYAGSFHMVGQWFPKLARLETDGRWAHFAFERLSEFYADFADYEVTVDVPETFTVGASGLALRQAREGGRLRTEYRARRVHDFAFTAWDGFDERHLTTAAGIAVRCLYPAGEHRLAEIELDQVAFGLEWLARHYGPYPYDHLTVVHPPREAREAGGMEYPTLITTGGSWHRGRGGAGFVENVTVHELAHQWFYGLVASNEFRWPFLDEGLTSFATQRLLEERYPDASAFQGLGFEVGLPAVARALAADAHDSGPIGRAAVDFEDGPSYMRLVYQRTTTVFETWRRTYGAAAMDAALAQYARAWRFRHPDPEALFAALEPHLGVPATGEIRKALMAGGQLDYALSSFEVTRLADGRYRTRAWLERRGDLVLPVEVAFVQGGAVVAEKRYEGDARRQPIEHVGSAMVDGIVLDPAHKLLLDHDLRNNVARARSGVMSASRTLLLGASIAQLLLAVVAP